jgi:4-methyl-5(b-hydroxyethyl)-thiazole monophosphate biosynthesis
MLVLPGGMPGTTNLGNCSLLTDKVSEFYACGKQIAAICAAPSIFAKLGLLKGRKATCNPSFEGVLTDNGALLTGEAVTISDNIITSQAMGTAIAFGLSIVEHYKGKDAADALGKNVLYYR